MTLAFAFFVCAAGSFSFACNVPVFRYALEHWRPDAYRAVLFHRGPLSTADQERLADLQGQAETTKVNLAIRAVDLDATPELADQKLFAAAETSDLPQLVVQYPAYLQLDQPVWSRRFGEAELPALLDSPARQKVLQRLSAGQTAVWLMVDSGDPAQDDVAAATLDKELKNLQRTLKLPELTDSPEDVIQDGPPVRLEFSVLRIRRDDPAEKALVTLLLGCESDLATLNEPLVFPVFGRCRALLPLVGPGISPDNIHSSAAFLSGACSCQVKELNPGFDLLITANWKELLSWAKSPAFASGEAPVGDPELVPIPTGSKSKSSQPASQPDSAHSTDQPDDATVSATPSAPSGSTGSSSQSTTIILACLVLTGVVALCFRRS